MTCVRFIGDIHGKMIQYLDVLAKPGDYDKSIQVGDYGIGFVNNPIPSIQTKHRFIRGNHDWPEGCTFEYNWIPDGTVEDNMMFIGGAYSIDRAWRIEGVDYWEDEELSYDALFKLIDKYEQVKPEIMVSHECPDFIAEIMCQSFNKKKFDDGSRTRKALESMWQIHKPKFWIFGHWHHDFVHTIEGTTFICLNELSYIDLEV